MSLNRRPIRMLALLAGLACALAAQQAAAQGTSNMLPDPISSRELSRYGDRLALSPQQRQAVESLHDQYKEEFRVLREGEIEEFLTDARGLQRGGMGAIFSDQKALQKAIKDYDVLLGKVRSIDNRLFDQTQSVLTDEQIANLMRVRQARERVRYRSGAGLMMRFVNPATRVDLSEIALDLNLSPQQARDVDPLLMAYESSLTSACRKLHDESITTLTDLVTQFQTLMANAMAGGAENRGQVMQTFRASMEEAGRKLAERAAGVGDLNRRSLKTIEPLLDAPTARRMRTEYFQQAYPELGIGATNQTERAFDLALKLEDLTEEQRAAVTAHGDEFLASSDRLVDEMVSQIDEQRKTRSLMSFDGESQRRLSEALDELRSRRGKLSDSALATLRDVLGPELSGKLDSRLAEAPKTEVRTDGRVMMTVAPAAGGAGISTNVSIAVRGDGIAVTQSNRDPFVPGPIGRRDLDRYATRLNLADEARSVLNSLHEEYLEGYRALEESTLKPLMEASQKLWAGDQNVPAQPTPQAIDSLYDRRRSAMSAVMALDSAFFDDVDLTLGSEELKPAVQRLRHSRQRDAYAVAAEERGLMMFAGDGRMPRQRFGSPGAMFNGGEEYPLDLSALGDDLQLAKDNAAFDTALQDYETAVTDAFKRMYESAMRLQISMDKMRAAATRVDGDGRQQQVRMFGDGFREVMESDGRASREARRAVLTLNRSTITKLEGLLEPAQAGRLRREYHRRAYPGIFDDPSSAQPRFESALALDDLTPQQRSQVQDMSLEYGASYEALCSKMIELVAQSSDSDSGPFSGGRDWQNIQDRMRERQKVDFDRNELNDKALVRLKAVLTAEQIAALGGLEPVETGTP